MHDALVTLIDQLDATAEMVPHVMSWSAPVPVFGDIRCASIASVGLNPSSREFVDDRDAELTGDLRRFHSLVSLGRDGWDDVDTEDIMDISAACENYFLVNPYDRWFRRMEAVLAATGASLYGPTFGACHLDLVPYATVCKWGALQFSHRRVLLDRCARVFGELVRDSRLDALVLNGRSVVEEFNRLVESRLTERPMPEWNLPRDRVLGYAYEGRIRAIAGVDLGRSILVLGYNHNIQSSFGVTSGVVKAIGNWVGQRRRGVS